MVQYELEGNTFIISNKVYPYANLAQWGSDNGRNMGTFDGQKNYDQLWILREDPTIKGFYTINNFTHVGSRVAKWGAGDGEVGNFAGQHYTDQLWKFDPHGSEENHYTITSYGYPNAKMAKWGAGDGDWGEYKIDDIFEYIYININNIYLCIYVYMLTSCCLSLFRIG